MFCKTIRLALLAGGILVLTAMPVRADDAEKETPKPATSDCTQYCTVCVKEWVPETYQTTRTVYHKVCEQVPCTVYKWETVPETRTRQVVCTRMVPETQTITKTICERVPCVETRMVCQTCTRYVTETTMVKKCVDKGHWECREVPCPPSILDRLHGLFHKHCGCKDACDPCADKCGDCGSGCGTGCGDCGNACCVKTKTVKCWVPCPTMVECPVTCCRKVCETKQVPVQVNTCKTVSRQVQCQVTVCKCVKECKTETYTCCVKKCVPCQTTKTVVKCVPSCETVTCCRMVCKMVQKQVPVCAPAPCCTPAPCSACESSCCKPARCHHLHHCRSACAAPCEDSCCGHRHHLLHKHTDCGCGGLGFKHEASCCN